MALAVSSASKSTSSPNRSVASKPKTSAISKGAKQHVVKKGDTLSEIAQKHGHSLRSVKTANPQIRNPDRIYPGQSVNLPASTTASRIASRSAAPGTAAASTRTPMSPERRFQPGGLSSDAMRHAIDNRNGIAPTSRADRTRGVQQQLKAKGFDPGPVDGISGPRTRAAVRDFQRANNLRVDGIAGPNTRAALNGTSNAAPRTTNPTGNVAADIQNVGRVVPGRNGVPAGLRPNAARGAAIVRDRFGFTGTIGGLGHRSGPSDHPHGNAIDVMTNSNRTQGRQIAEYFRQNHDQLGVKYVIFEQRIASSRNNWAWRPMADRGSPTANHMDHPHISFR